MTQDSRNELAERIYVLSLESMFRVMNPQTFPDCIFEKLAAQSFLAADKFADHAEERYKSSQAERAVLHPDEDPRRMDSRVWGA